MEGDFRGGRGPARLGLAAPSSTVPRKPGPRLFSEQLFGQASKMSWACFWRRPKSASRQHGMSVARCRSGRRERGLAGAAGPVPGQSWAGGGPVHNGARTVPGLQTASPEEPPGRGNHKAVCAQAPGRGAEPWAGNRMAAGRMEVAGSKLFSACPCEFQICCPPFGEAFPGRQPGPRSSLLGAAQGGRAGRAWPPTLSELLPLHPMHAAGSPRSLPPRFY